MSGSFINGLFSDLFQLLDFRGFWIAIEWLHAQYTKMDIWTGLLNYINEN